MRVDRRSTVFFDASPRIYMAFHKPPAPAHDDFVFDLLDVLLGEGRTGRLYKRLVLKDKLAQGIGTFEAPGARLPNLFAIAVIPLQGVTKEKIEAAVWDELEKLKTESVSDKELEKVRNRVVANQARSLDSNGGLASSLSLFQSLIGDWRYLLREPKEVAALTADDVKQTATKYFKHENSVTVDLQK
jgi:predicted Zn-dependent peptidase